MLKLVHFAVLSMLAAHVTRGDVIQAASCSAADIQTAVNSASNGDTVQVSGGNCTWTGSVTISSSHQITLDGLGTTNITFGSNDISATVGSVNTTRITGFTFTGSETNGGCKISFDGLTASTQPFRLDHNTLDGGTPGGPGTIVCISGNGPGLIDNNDFTTHNGADEVIHVLGLGPGGAPPSSWTNVVTPGSSDMIFIEDNTIACSGCGVYGSAWQSYYGARTVGRYNTLTNMIVDQHGGGGVGARWWELYNNTFATNDLVCIRAGSGFVFNNSGAADIRMTQESAGTYYIDMIGVGQNGASTPAYVWGNGATDLLLNTTQGCAAGGAGPLTLGVEVYNASTGTSLPGTCSTFDGFFKTDTNTLYKCTATNTWTEYYTPYTYPHPLQSSGATTRRLMGGNGGRSTARIQ